MLKLEARPQPSQAMAWSSPLIALAITALIAAALFAALGKDPIRGLEVFFIEPLNGRRALSEVLLKATPLVIIALGLALCYRANVWNIGAEGQFLLGCVGGGGVALWLTTQGIVLPKVAGITLVLMGGMLGGMLWAAIVALLRDRFNANEILVSLMLVYVAQQVVNWLVFGPWKDPQGFNMPQSKAFDASLLLPPLLERTRLHIGALVALVAVAAMTLFMFRTYRGFALQVGGLAPMAARYAGFSARGALWTGLLVSGALAGLAGAMEVAGPVRQVTPYLSMGYGFTAIIVCFVGRLHPVGVVFAGILLSMLLIGGELAQSRLGLPSALSSVLQGLLLLVLLACDTLIAYRVRWAGAKPASKPQPAPVVNSAGGGAA
jgi:general nucleoside transport system permease protein